MKQKKANYIFSFIGFLGFTLTIGATIVFSKTVAVHKDCEKTMKDKDSLHKLEITKFQLNEDTLFTNYYIVNRKDLKLQNYVRSKQRK